MPIKKYISIQNKFNLKILNGVDNKIFYRTVKWNHNIDKPINSKNFTQPNISGTD